MAPKRQPQTEEIDNTPNTDDETPNDGQNESTIDTFFDLDDDYKPEPVMRNGWYKGFVTENAIDLSAAKLSWKVTLSDNGGYMSDGETPVDGTSYTYNNWLPRPEDKDLSTASGKNKWQTKVNMLKRFSEDMQVDMKNISVMEENVTQQNWIGIPVLIELKAETYQGQTFMRGQNMKRREDK